MSEFEMDAFEARFEQRLQRHAAIPVRPVDATSVAAETMAMPMGPLQRVKFVWTPMFRPAFGSGALLVVIGLLLAITLAVVAASLNNPLPNPVTGKNGLIAYSVAESPDYRTSRLHLINGDGTGDRELGEGSSVTYSIDGKSLAYVVGFGIGRAQLFVGELDGANSYLVPGFDVVPGFHMQGYALSPDGDQVAMPYNDDTGYTGQIGLHSVDTGALSQMVAAPADFPASWYDLDAAWSPDGRYLALTVWRGFDDIFGPYRVAVVVVDTESGETRTISTRMAQSAAIAWSPDSKSVAFIGWPDGTPGPSSTGELVERPAEIYAVNLDTGVEAALTQGAIAPENPVWSPDGKSIAYVSMGDGDPRVAVADLDEAGQPVQPRVGPVAIGVTWAPDSTRLLIFHSRERVQFDPTQSDTGFVRVVDRVLASDPITLVTADGLIGSISWQRLDP